MTRTGRSRSGDGDGWAVCGRGHRHWGRFGAAGLLVRDAGPEGMRVLLQHRAAWSQHGGTWGIPGGARDSDETPVDAALREAAEEAGVAAGDVRPYATYLDDHGGWAYTTVLAVAAVPGRAVVARADGWESTAVRRVAEDALTALPLHPGFAATWPAVQAVRPLTVLVDVANVVGSRPDGWWRDRPGAIRRVLAGLAGLTVPDGPVTALPRVVAVVEGAAGREVAAGPVPAGVEVVAAAGSGDDALVASCGHLVSPGQHILSSTLVVTADRELRDRVRALGAEVAGPRWLLDRPGWGTIGSP